MEPYFVVTGLVVGVLVTLTGVGGGSVMTPWLILGFGVPPATAVGTDLLYAFVTKTVAMGVHAKDGRVDWGVVRLFLMGSLPAAGVALLALWWLEGTTGTHDTLITTTLSIALILSAGALLLKERIERLRRRLADHQLPLTNPATPRKLLTVLVGLFVGSLVTLSSVGAGALGVPLLLLLYPRLKTHSLVATDITQAVPLTLLGGLGYIFFLGSVDFQLLANLLLGSMIGIYLGSRLTIQLPERALRGILAAVLTGVAFRMVY